MNIQHNLMLKDYNLDIIKRNPSQNNYAKNRLKIIHSNKLSVATSKNSNSNVHHTHISTFEDEEIEKDEEEEEINSDEYVSSTNLDVDTNTYINTMKDNEDDSSINVSIKNHQKERLKLVKSENNYEESKNSKILNNIYKIKTINTQYRDLKKINTISISNDIIKKGHHYFKSDLLNDIYKRQYSTSKGKKVAIISKSNDKNYIFTPDNKNKKTLKLLYKNKKHGQNNKSLNINNMNKLNTINFIDNNLKEKNLSKNRNHSNALNNDTIKLLSNNMNKINNKNMKQKNIQNNNININIYNKNIIKDIKGININSQKYHIIPLNNQKLKTQRRIGKIIFNDQNKKIILFI